MQALFHEDLTDDRTCIVCGVAEAPNSDKFKMKLDDECFQMYKMLDDMALIQFHTHKLPQKVNEMGEQIPRGACRTTYHKKCLQDYICVEIRTNITKATQQNRHVVYCANCKRYPFAQCFLQKNVDFYYNNLGPAKVIEIEERNGQLPLLQKFKSNPLPNTLYKSLSENNWVCEECTTSNPETSNECEVCGQERPKDQIKTQELVQVIAGIINQDEKDIQFQDDFQSFKIESNFKLMSIIEPENGIYQSSQMPDIEKLEKIDEAIANIYKVEGHDVETLLGEDMRLASLLIEQDEFSKLTQQMAAAICFLAGNQTSLKRGEFLCTKACKISQVSQALQIKAKIGPFVDIVNKWAQLGFAEILPWIGHCVRFESNQPQEMDDIRTKYKKGNIVQWNTFNTAQIHEQGLQAPPYMQNVNTIFNVYSKSGRSVKNFSRLQEKAIIFSPTTQFMVCDSKLDQSTGILSVDLREVQVGGQDRTIMILDQPCFCSIDPNDEHKLTPVMRLPKQIIDTSYKNGQRIIRHSDITTANAFVQSPLFERVAEKQFKIIFGTLNGKDKPGVILAAKQIVPRLKKFDASIAMMLTEDEALAQQVCLDSGLTQNQLPLIVSQNNLPIGTQFACDWKE